MLNQDLYYIVIQNEVYECKFMHLIAPVSKVKVENFLIGNFNQVSIYLNVASKGVMKWQHYAYKNDFLPKDIYFTIEDAINQTNSVFSLSMGNWVGIKNILTCNDFPKLINGTWEIGTVFGGAKTMDAVCYIWDGLQAKKTQIKSPITHPLLYANSYGTLHFDFATMEFLYDENQNKRYETAEDCIRHNAVKVHCFA